MHAYCLFCQTNRCGAIARFLRATSGYQVIQPRIVQRRWVKGEAFREEHDYLPGYLFLYAQEPLTDIAPLLRIDGVLRCLGYIDYKGVKHIAELAGDDRHFADMLYGCQGLIDTMKVFREGDRLKPAGGLLAELEGRIVKVDRQRQRLLMEYDFDNVKRQAWVGFDVIEDQAGQSDAINGA